VGHLVRQHELTGLRLLTLHNLTFVGALMERLRAAIAAGSLAETAAALRGGAAPFA
jgi:queuine tRNA-ribosyltransferase